MMYEDYKFGIVLMLLLYVACLSLRSIKKKRHVNSKEEMAVGMLNVLVNAILLGSTIISIIIWIK